MPVLSRVSVTTSWAWTYSSLILIFSQEKGRKRLFNNISKMRMNWLYLQPLNGMPFSNPGACFLSGVGVNSAYFYYQARLPPLNSQVGQQGKRLFLALYKNSSYKFLAYVYTIAEFIPKVNLFFTKNLNKIYPK